MADTSARSRTGFMVIPAIDLIEGRCVRLWQGRYDHQTTYPMSPESQALRFQEAGSRRLHIIDLEGAADGGRSNREVIRQVRREVEIPVQTGGGIRTDGDVAELIEAGIDFLILGTVAIEEPQLVEHWIDRWGADRFIVSLDLKHGKLRSRGWTRESAVTLEEMTGRIRSWGVAQVICTDVERDGTLDQPAYETYEMLRLLLGGGIDLIAAGGVSRPQHLRGLKEIGVVGAVIGRALYEGDVSLEDFLRAG